MPLFILLGELILRAGLSDNFYRSMGLWFHGLKGGLLQSNIVVACAIFAAVSGSSVATAAAIGTVAIPEMTRRGYEPKILFGSLAAGADPRDPIPPSIPASCAGDGWNRGPAITDIGPPHL